MHYQLIDENNLINHETDCLLVAVFSDEEQALSHTAQMIDDATDQAISAHLRFGDFNGKLNSAALLYPATGIAAKRILLVGCGKRAAFNVKKLAQTAQTAATQLLTMNIHQATSCLASALPTDHTAQALQQCVLAQAKAAYRFVDYKSDAPKAPTLSDCLFAVAMDTDPDSEHDHAKSETLTQSFAESVAIAHGMSLTQDLANLPSNVCTPSYLAEQAHDQFADYEKLSVQILEESDMEALNMGAFLSVGKGSDEPSKFILLEYNGAASDADQAPIVLVGKGITFDTGGISIKPSGAMDEMKYDMGGAASVFGAMKACCELQLPINVVAAIAAAENMPSGKASKPGDIVTTMSGQTVEILNTDAEGRLVLCDALTYIGKYQPKAVIDLATLTGACIVALGHHISGLMANDDDLADQLVQAGDDAQDAVWRLPMTDDYQNQLKSNFADIPNIGADRSAGTITAACFLSRFTQDYRWAHIDIAGTAWRSGAKKGATGRPVPLLTQFLITQSKVV
ncbi:MAG TPA: leucyl aminopeptidase [Thiothrix sp.]|nr:leucyl aminopeptidase [Thiothrix sp.]